MERVDYQSLLVQDFVNMAKNDELNLRPWYQRRSVWTEPQRAYLINTLLENMPVPTVYIRYQLDTEQGKVVKEVVDGQQRLSSILQYVSNEFSARPTSLRDKVKFSGLAPSIQKRFLLTQLAVGVLVDASEADVIEIFGRLNSVSKTLNAQEKRNAQFSGDMKQFCLKEAATRISFWRNNSVFTSTQISRMDEVQFISDVVFNLINGLSDFNQKKLTEMYKRYESNFDAEDDIRGRIEKIFSVLARLPKGVISETIFSRSPVLFSLMLILDKLGASKKPISLSDSLYRIDALFREGGQGSLKFREAVLQTSQRIGNRRIREDFIESHL